MSLEIKAIPAAYSSVHGDLIYTVADTAKVSDPTTYPNFKFIGDVYIGASLVARLRRWPDPATGIGIFNVSDLVRNYMELVFNPAGSGIRPQEIGQGMFNLPVTMKFGEEYSFTDYLNVVVDSTRTFFNHYNSRLIGVSSSLAALVNKVASNRPVRGGSVLLSSLNHYIPYFPTSTSPVSITITPNVGLTYTTSITPTNANDLQLLNVAPVNINSLQANSITANTKYYDVAIGSQTYRIYVVCESIYTAYTLHFLNQYGGFESFLFPKVSRQKTKGEKQDYGKLPFVVDGSGSVNYNTAAGVYLEQRATYASQFTESMDLNSDLLTDGEYAWLRDLVVSPLVYLEEGGYFTPVIIKESDYEKKKRVNDEPFNLNLTIEFGNQLNAQYR